MKKNKLLQWIALPLVAAVMLGLAACSREKEPPETQPADGTEFSETESESLSELTAVPGTWRIELRGTPNVTSFSSEDAQHLPKVEVEMNTTNLSTGLSSKTTYGGVTLRSLLNFCGVFAVNSVTVSSINGTSVIYNPAMAMADDTILAWEVDGAPIDAEPPLRMCPNSGQSEMHVKQVSSLTISVAAGNEETTTTTTTYPTYSYIYNDNYVYTTQRTTYTYATVPTTSTQAGTTSTTTSTQSTTTTSSTAATTTTKATTKSTSPSYVYTQPPTNATTTTASTTPVAPDWWPPGIPYP